MEKELKPGELVLHYIEKRNALSLLRKNFKEAESNLKAEMEEIEVKILEFQDKNDLQSISSTKGTAYKTLKQTYRIGDWDKFIEFVAETENWQMLEKRCAKIATKEILDDKSNDKTSVDIGIDFSEEYVIQIRKK